MKALLRTAVVFAAIAVMMQSVSLLLTEAQFLSNHSYIASSLCENRDKPQMHCDGKCYLKKELNHQQEQQNSSHTTIHQIFSFSLIFEETEAYHFFCEAHDFCHPFQTNSISAGFCATNERPPTFIARHLS